MQLSKIHLIAVATAFLCVAACLSVTIMTRNTKKQAASQEQNAAVSDTNADTDVAPEAGAALTYIPVAGDTIFQQSKSPALKIIGYENTDIYLKSLDIQVEVTGNIASTRYTMTVKNRSGRVVEGRLAFSLPPGRGVTHFALDIDGKMREAVPVEKAKGTEVFEEIVSRVVVDPGLLETVDDSTFRVRIYPVPAYGVRTVSIGYEEELTRENDSLRYRLSIAYPDSLEKFTAKATVLNGGHKPVVPDSVDRFRFKKVGGNYVASFAGKKYRPFRELNFALRSPVDIPLVIVQSAQGSYCFLASVAPKLETPEKVWDNDLAIIWDVSLSGSQRDIKRELEALDIIFAEKKNADVSLYFLNNRFKKVDGSGSGNDKYRVIDGNWDNLRKTLEAAVFDGGTDFSQINLSDVDGNEILFFSDGISTLGDADFLVSNDIKRPIHCVVSSAKANYGVMKSIAGKTKGKFVNINALSHEKLKGDLLNETLRFLGTEHGKSVSEVYPSIATPVHGDFSLAGISNVNDADITLLFGFGDKVEKRIAVKLDASRTGKRGSAYKIWAQKKIAELDLNYEKNRAELTALRQRFGIVTRNASLIVLETVGDYVRYNIEPPGVGGQKSGDGGADKKGVAGVGYGSGYGLRFGGGGMVKTFLDELTKKGGDDIEQKRKDERRVSFPGFFKGGGVVGGRSMTSIQDIIRQNMAALRYAYSKRLGKKPDLCGRITVNFHIDEFGTVFFARVAESTVNDDELETAVVARIKSWSFYKIDKPGDVTEVTCPLVFDGPCAAVTKESAEQQALEKAEREAWEKATRAGDTLNGAVIASYYFKRWRNIDFMSPMSGTKVKYPAQDEEKKRSSGAIFSKSAIAKDADYLKMMTGKTADDYQTYLSERKSRADSPAFYFDMASWFYALGDRETAIRVLTSIADLEFENASLYRLLGYRLKEFGEYALEKSVCKKVVLLRPTEPQSYRDYALALADNGEAQAALDCLYGVLTKTYSDDIRERSRGIEELIIMEINSLIAKNAKLDVSQIDKRLITDVSVDVRAVINWNMDNTVIDMYVSDPNNEMCFHENRVTNIGGRTTSDLLHCFGPEHFILKNAVKGKYRVYAHYVDDRRVTSSVPLTVMAEIYTKYAGKDERREIVCFQMSNLHKRQEDGKILVAEFEF